MMLKYSRLYYRHIELQNVTGTIVQEHAQAYI